MAATDHREKTGRVDNSKAKIIAYIVVAGFLALILVFGMRTAGQTALHDGDERKSIECKFCQGTGEVQDERCKYCLGAKKVKVVIPGPNHPLRIQGTVWDLSAFKNKEEAESFAATTDYTKVSLRPDPKTVRQAALTFNDGSQQTLLEGKVNGRYRGFVSPGSYTLEVVAEGYQPAKLSLVVPPREHPVWPEMAGVQPEDEDQITFEIYLEKSP